MKKIEKIMLTVGVCSIIVGLALMSVFHKEAEDDDWGETLEDRIQDTIEGWGETLEDTIGGTIESVGHYNNWNQTGEVIKSDNGYYIQIGQDSLKYYAPDDTEISLEQWKEETKQDIEMIQKKQGTVVLDKDDMDSIQVSTIRKNIHWEKSHDDNIHIKNLGEYGVVFMKDDQLRVYDYQTKKLVETTVVISVPSEKWEHLTLDTTSGNIEMKNVKAEECVITTTSGDIKIEDVEANDATFDTTSGELVIQEGKFEQLLSDTTSGDMNYKKLKVKETMTMDTTSGDIVLDKLESRDIEIATTSGDIQIEGTIKGDIHVDTTSGNLQLQLNGKKKKYEYVVDTKGQIVIDGDEKNVEFDQSYEKSDDDSEYELFFMSTSGDCIVSFHKD